MGFSWNYEVNGTIRVGINFARTLSAPIMSGHWNKERTTGDINLNELVYRKCFRYIHKVKDPFRTTFVLGWVLWSKIGSYKVNKHTLTLINFIKQILSRAIRTDLIQNGEGDGEKKTLRILLFSVYVWDGERFQNFKLIHKPWVLHQGPVPYNHRGPSNDPYI